MSVKLKDKGDELKDITKGDNFYVKYIIIKKETRNFIK